MYENENSQLMVHIQQSVQYLSVTYPVHQAFNIILHYVNRQVDLRIYVNMTAHRYKLQNGNCQLLPNASCLNYLDNKEVIVSIQSSEHTILNWL